jgi:translation initiation factor 1
MTTKPDSPFAALEALRAQLPAGKSPEAKTASEPTKPKGPTRAVVRLEKKQRRGKECTVVEKLGLRPDDLEQWCRELKSALGCGGAVEGDAIMLQGDLRTRLPELLRARGVAKVTVG